MPLIQCFEPAAERPHNLEGAVWTLAKDTQESRAAEHVGIGVLDGLDDRGLPVAAYRRYFADDVAGCEFGEKHMEAILSCGVNPKPSRLYDEDAVRIVFGREEELSPGLRPLAQIQTFAVMDREFHQGRTVIVGRR